MKPLQINLGNKSQIWTKVVLAFIVIFAFTTLGITITTIYEYYENNKVIETIEIKISQTNKRFKEKRKIIPKPVIDSVEQQRLNTQLAFLSTQIKRSMRSIPLMLNELEYLKPEKVNIHELSFTQDLKELIIKGESKFFEEVSRFVIDMNRSKRFDVEITKESFNDNKKISFELTAKWIEIKDDQKI